MNERECIFNTKMKNKGQQKQRNLFGNISLTMERKPFVAVQCSKEARVPYKMGKGLEGWQG